MAPLVTASALLLLLLLLHAANAEDVSSYS
jgi:hypothetical protein